MAKIELNGFQKTHSFEINAYPYVHSLIQIRNRYFCFMEKQVIVIQQVKKESGLDLQM